MKLIRFGEPGRERPGAIDRAGVRSDLSSVINDLGGDNLGPASIARLKALDLSNLPVVPDEVRAKIIADIPTGRLGKPEEIAYAVAFLVAEEASWITGSNLDINGGHHMGW